MITFHGTGDIKMHFSFNKGTHRAGREPELTWFNWLSALYSKGRLAIAVASLMVGLMMTPVFAATVLYLDFDGHQEPSYPVGGQTFAHIQVPAFDLTGDSNAPQDIYRRIEEDFAPFDVELTLQAPHDVDQGFYAGGNRHVLRVAIGGSAIGSGYPREVNGVSTHPANYNTVFAFQFDGSQGRRSNKEIAKTASHEIAHALGFSVASPLSHYTEQAHHSIAGQMPILGSFLSPDARDVWFKHDDVALGFDPRTDEWIWGAQDDIATLTAALDIRADDHGGTPQLATPLTPVSSPSGTTRVQGEGIIELSPGNYPSACPPQRQPAARWRPWCSPIPVIFGNFKDFFVFQAGWGSGGSQWLRIRVSTINTSPTDGAANVDTDLELWFQEPSTGQWRQLTNVSRNTTGLSAELAYRLGTQATGAGVYGVAVKSQGGYSDVGQYTISVKGEDVSQAEVWREPRFVQTWVDQFLRQLETLVFDGSMVEAVDLLAAFGLLSVENSNASKIAEELEFALDQFEIKDVFRGLFVGETWETLSVKDRDMLEQRFYNAFERITQRITRR